MLLEGFGGEEGVIWKSQIASSCITNAGNNNAQKCKGDFSQKQNTLGNSGIWYPIIHMVEKRENGQGFVEWGHLHILIYRIWQDLNVLLYHALSSSEEDFCSFWETLVSSQRQISPPMSQN